MLNIFELKRIWFFRSSGRFSGNPMQSLQDALRLLSVASEKQICYCIRSSIPLKAALSLSAFLISSAVTYGYSPYSRKLGHWCSRTNLTNAGDVGLPVFGKAFQILKNRVHPTF